MTRSGVDGAYKYCQRLTKREAKNFYYGFMLLPYTQRRAIYAVYAFARQCDDIADADSTAEEASRRLLAYRESLGRCLNGDPEGPVFNALNDAIREFSIQPQYLYDLIEGVELDLSVRRYGAFTDLKRYCYLVASTVGLICLDIFGCRDPERARRHAADLGIALQLTNILRDVQEDAGRGRIYLPQEDLVDFGYSEGELLARRITPAFRGLMKYETERARGFYAEGRKLLPLLPRRARACVGTMAGIYKGILDDIGENPAAIFRQRISLSTGHKMALAGRELVRSFAP